MRHVDEVQSALIEYLKSDTILVNLLGTPDQIKETEWQGADFIYPAVRVENTIKPNKVYCSPDDVEITIFCLSEKKSSKQCSQISARVADLLHDLRNISRTNDLIPKVFTSGVQFVFFRVTSIPYPKQQENQNIWVSPVEVVSQVK